MIFSQEERKENLLKQQSHVKSDFFFRFVIKSVVFVALIVLAYSLVSDQIKINSLSTKSEELNLKLKEIQEENEVLDYYTKPENQNEYIEQIARDRLDYAHPDERVYYIVPNE